MKNEKGGMVIIMLVLVVVVLLLGWFGYKQGYFAGIVDSEPKDEPRDWLNLPPGNYPGGDPRPQ